MINLKNVIYNYETFSKEKGFRGALKDFKRREKTIVNAIKSIDILINQGEIIGLIGPNGAGKTTLIKLMTGILAPSSGQVICAGFEPFQKDNDYLKKIGVVLGQKSQLIWDLPALETLELIRVIYDINEKSYKEKLDEMLKLLNVEHKLNTPVRKLSLGERVKFEIICSLIHSPEILFLDEPTIGLDITSQKMIHQFLLKINRETKTTIILTSHYMKDIEALCERVMIIMDGSIISDMPIKELKNQVQIDDEYILEFKDIIPETALHFAQVDDKTIKIPHDQLHNLLDYIDLNEINTLYRNRPDFENIIYNIFTNEKGL